MNSSWGQNCLGVCYRVQQNYEEAVKWYRLSAEQGYSYAQNNLGLMYENGEGVDPVGGVEAIITLKALEDGIIPPTINYKVKDEECDLNIVPNKPIKKDIKIAMSNSLGFGGHNASIIMKKWEL